jgi:hypothetical protein
LLDTCNKNLPPIEPVIDGVLYRGHTLLSGPPKAGKSFLALQFAYAVASGEDALGSLTVKRRGPVLYLALEDGERRIKDRSAKLLGGRKPRWLADINIVYELRRPLDSPEGLAELEATLAARPYELLVVDTYVKAFQADTGGSDLFKSDYKQMDVLTQLARKFDLAVLTNAHSRKPGKGEKGTELVSVAGTGGRTAAPDAGLMLAKTGKGAACLNVISRDTEELEIMLQRNSTTGGWETVGAATAPPKRANASRGKGKVLELLRTSDSLTGAEIKKALCPPEDDGNVAVWITRLSEDRQIVIDTQKRYSVPVGGAAATAP